MNGKILIGKNKLNLFLDIGIALAFAAVMEQHFTGIRIHELLGLGFGVALVVHILLHWRWVWNVTRHFFQKVFHESRFNYVLNLALFIDMVVIIVTGIGISRTLGLELGIERSLSSTFERLHILASNLSLILIGLHVAMHWKWIATHAQKYLLPGQFWRLPSRNTQPIPAASNTNTLSQEA